jgi:ketosteroid isomerase-like protein
MAFEDGDLSGAIAVLSPEMVTYVAPPLPVSGTYHGPEGFLQVTIDWAEEFDELVMTSREFIDAEDHVVVRALHKSRGAASGVPVERELWYVFTVDAGMAIRADVFADQNEALEAAGLRE